MNSSGYTRADYMQQFEKGVDVHGWPNGTVIFDLAATRTLAQMRKLIARAGIMIANNRASARKNIM
jgi:hypothetical protein